MKIRKMADIEIMRFVRAEWQDRERALEFYNNLIDDMKDSEFAPCWVKGVYPTITVIERAISKNALYFAEIDQDIVGAFVIDHVQGAGFDQVEWAIQAKDEEVASIHLLATSPKMQRHGIGKKLLKKAAELAKESGCKVIRLNTRIWNIPGHKLYKSFGFQNRGDVTINHESTGENTFRLYELVLK